MPWVPGITAAQPGQPGAVYALTGPGWSGTLPEGVIQIQPGVNNGAIIFRADKFVKNGSMYEDMRQEAETFRRSLCLIPVRSFVIDLTVRHVGRPAREPR